jgi:hypothetical protein
MFAASLLKFIRLLIRLGRNVGAEAEKSGNRNADGRPHLLPQIPQSRLLNSRRAICQFVGVQVSS